MGAVSECAQGICNTWKKNAVCMASSWVSKRENCCARQVGGRLGLEPARNAGEVDRRPHQRGASDEHRAVRVAHLSLQKLQTHRLNKEAWVPVRACLPVVLGHPGGTWPIQIHATLLHDLE